MTSYVAYGVRLESEIPLPGLPPARDGETATIQVLLDPPGRREIDPPARADAEFLVEGRPLRLHVNGDLDIHWTDVVRFRASVDGSRIRCARGPDGSAHHLREWLLHYTLPLLLAGTGRLHFLHGGGVEVGGRAVGFLAPSGGGKTTLTESFLRRGHAFFTDEKLGVVARGRRFVAVPSTPYYRRDEPRPRWRAVRRFAPAPLPLAALYLLVAADGGAAPAVAPVAAGEAAFALAQHSEFQLPPGVRGRLRLPPFRVASFALCTELAAAVRVRRLVVPRHLPRIGEVYETVVADVARTA